MLFALWAAMGWCGTPYPGWWKGPRPPGPPPDPWVVKIISLVGGILGGWMTQRVVGSAVGGAEVLATMAGAFAVGGLLGGLTALVAGGKAGMPG